MPTVSRTRTTHCLRSFWKPGSRHFGLALTGTQPRTTEAQCRGPAPVPGSGPECADVPGPAVCVCARVCTCVASPAHAQLASPAATHAQWVWQLCWHQRLEAVEFLPQTSPRPQPCPSYWTLGQLGATRLLSRAGRSTPPGPHPQILGCHKPLPAPCLALNDPAAQSACLAQTHKGSGQVSTCCPPPAREAGGALPGWGGC